jgi:hypothetical protein
VDLTVVFYFQNALKLTSEHLQLLIFRVYPRTLFRGGREEVWVGRRERDRWGGRDIREGRQRKIKGNEE